MSKDKYVYLVYQKDFSENSNDRYFLYDNGAFSEVSSNHVVSLDCFIITHDFWLISNSLYKSHGILPSKVIDVVLLSKIVAGIKRVDGDVQPWDVSKTVKPLYKETKDFDNYMSMYYRREELVNDTYMLFSHKLAEYADLLFEKSSKANELERFFSLELPIYSELVLSACRGIPVDNKIVRQHKDRLKSDFYRELKLFAEKHRVLYSLPNEGEITEKLAKLGYNVEDYSLDFLIDFLPSLDEYTVDLRRLQKVDKSYRIFNALSTSVTRIKPIVESHLTSTSRIYHKSPNIQNISKKYRDIFVADEGFSLCYVDYDQFEVGVMAALSGDPKMKYIYENKDTYTDLAEQVFNSPDFRNKAKIMFLSYTYGMSLENIMSSISQLGGNKKKAKEYFSEFSVFENWKGLICEAYQDQGRIPTISANFLNRQLTGDLSSKERRTTVNHLIQGTATYIFKKALLELSKLEGVQLLIPMHDAILFQYQESVNPGTVVKIFEDTMTSVLEGKVKGKASIEHFYEA